MKKLLLPMFCVISVLAFAQNQSEFTKFGKITAAHLQTKVYPIDSSANAVVLSDIGDAAIVGNSKGWFSISIKKHKVVHILSKNGYDEANIEIPLHFNDGAEEQLENVKAVTYNLQDGKVVETKLEKAQIFKEKINDRTTLRKFTMPNIKEGSIIEIEYTFTSEFIWNLDPWVFQDYGAPTIWSEFIFSVPEFFSYSFLSRGYHAISINERKDRKENFTVRNTQGAGATETYPFSAGVTEYRWAMKDVPQLKTEPFTFTAHNHISRIEFELISNNYPLEIKNYRTSWATLVKTMLESENFGKDLGSNNNWLGDDIKFASSTAVSGIEKAQKIYAYVRDNFTTTSRGGKYLSQPLKNVLKTKKGTVADVNLLLTAMLRYAGIEANPVMLSTTEHGYTMDSYPMESNYNYIIVEGKADGKTFYLDATEPLMGFNKLQPFCYNGHARVISEENRPVYFAADSLKETQNTFLLIANDEKGAWVGSMTQTAGYNASYHIREDVKEKGREEFFKKVEKDFGIDAKISEPFIDSLKHYDLPVRLRYTVNINHGGEEILYINPMFGEGYKKNPFTSAQRYYSVEMPSTSDETFVMNMEVPKGYVVDELPKQMLAKFDEEGKTYFEYRISHSGDIISFRCRVKVDRALFMPEEYENLREFFNLVVKKQGEQIVFKKKK